MWCAFSHDSDDSVAACSPTPKPRPAHGAPLPRSHPISDLCSRADFLRFIALVPANLLGLAAPVTTAIVSVRPTYHSYRALTDEKEDVKHLLTFYVALGLFQTVEGCVPTWVLERIRKKQRRIRFTNQLTIQPGTTCASLSS